MGLDIYGIDQIMPKCQVQEKNAPQFNLIAAVIITSKREELIKDEKIETTLVAVNREDMCF